MVLKRDIVETTVMATILLLACCAGITTGSSFLLLAGPAPNGWQTESDITREAAIIDGIIEMYESDNMASKSNWYEQGHGYEGELTLKSLGVDAVNYSKNDTLYNFYVDAFLDIGVSIENETYGIFDRHPAEQYAHAIVDDLLLEASDINSDGIQSEAVLVTGLWMRVYHHIFDNLRLCRNGGDSRLMLNNIDKAAALWIGDKQTYGSNTAGVLLYNLAERTSVAFGQDETESQVNTRFLSILSNMKATIEGDQCRSESDSDNNGYDLLHYYITDAVRQMNILLVQRMIHFIESDIDTKYTELYALALIPQIKACSTSDFNYFMNNVVFEKADASESLHIAHLQRMYSCLGVTCEDIGAYSGDRVPQCDGNEIEPEIALASYLPVSDVYLHSKADRDMLQIKILLRHGNINAAMDLYKKGRNMVTRDSYVTASTSSSLQHLASDQETFTYSDDRARLHYMFEDYYDNDASYADKLVLTAFDKYASSQIQLETAIPLYFQTIVAPHYAVRAFFEAVDVCEEYGDRAASVYDQGVAVLVGSNEGPNEGGSSDGLSWFALGKELCPEFNCDDSENQPVYKSILDMFLDGRLAIADGDCSSLENHVDRMESLLLIPIIQGLLYHSQMRRLSSSSDTKSMELHIAALNVFAEAIIPVVEKVSEVQAHIIRESILEPDITTIAERIWTAIGRVMDDGSDRRDMGITCGEIGNPNIFLNGQSFCEYVKNINFDPTPAPVKAADVTDSPSLAPTMSPTKADKSLRINRILINGRYTFTNITQAEEQARIALDLRDIIQLDYMDAYDDKEKKERAQAIYEGGANAIPQTLEQYGTLAPLEMNQDALYNFYRHSWRDETIFVDYGETGVNVVDTYADAVVLAALNEAGDMQLVAESVVALTMWMHIVHLLTKEVESCKTDQDRGVWVDNAFALYLGVGQTLGETDGHLLYSLAQKAGIIQLTIDFSTTGEARVNTQIVPLFQQAKNYAQLCQVDSTENFKALRETVGKIISMMNVPFVQYLEHYLAQMHINNEDATSRSANYAELYSLAILPQLEVCSPTDYDFLTSNLIDNGINTSEIDNILTILQKNYKCLGISCADVHGSNDYCPPESTALAGFLPKKNVNENAAIDQDILKIMALVDQEALMTAGDYYKFGDPSSPGDMQYASLQVLALGNLLIKSPFHEDFSTYHNGNENYSDDFVMDALSPNPSDFTMRSITSEAEDRSMVLLRALQTMILLPAGLGSMMYAVELCQEGESYDEVLREWDRAAAFVIGSIEGDQRGGDVDENGVSIFGLAKEVCWQFSSCDSEEGGVGGASINDKLVNDFSTGEQLILSSLASGAVEFGVGGDCSTLEEYVKFSMVPTLLVPVIQATLDAVLHVDKPSAFVLARSITPIVHGFNPDSADKISAETRLGGSFNITVVANAFAGVLEDLGISCSDFNWKEYEFDFCSSSIDNSDGTSLSNGLYMTTTNVDEWANIDLDVIDMTEAINNRNFAMAKDFYLNGFNSHAQNSEGEDIGVRSIGQMSLMVDMEEEPVHNLYRYTLDSGDGTFLGEDTKHYANSLVMSFFDEIENNVDPSLMPVEAAVALNLWGHIVHKLYFTLERCDSKSFQGDNGVQFIDQAVAYWIGSAQLTGDSSRGHLLYRLTEEAGDLFGQGTNGQARVNRKLLQLFTEASRLLTFSNGCKDTATASNLRDVVQKIVSQMTVPLIQHLIASLQANDQERRKLYGHAVVPLITACNKATYDSLREKLIYTADTNQDEIISLLQSTYYCLGITCNDVGDFAGGVVPTCNNRQDLDKFAGYTPRTNAQEYSDIDLDIRYIEIMSHMNAYGAAKDVYMLGKHAYVANGVKRGLLSLQYLATSAERTATPSYQLFNRYFSDQNYANSAIMELFAESGRKSPGQRKVEIVNILRYMVVPMAALQKIHQALENCNVMSSSVSQISNRRWDEGAALIFGSMEGSKKGGSGNGYLLPGLANDLCLEFGVCGSRGNAQVNYLIREALYAGSSSLSDQSCTTVFDSVQTLESQLIIPLIQASLLSAVENSKLGGNTNAESIASGYVYSQAVLPYIQDQTEPTAVIARNLNFQVGSAPPVEDGWQSVFHAFEMALENMDDISCRDVGYSSTVNAGICPDDGVIAFNAAFILNSSNAYFLVITSLITFNCLTR